MNLRIWSDNQVEGLTVNGGSNDMESSSNWGKSRYKKGTYYYYIKKGHWKNEFTLLEVKKKKKKKKDFWY